jgi:hypothetical protein
MMPSFHGAAIDAANAGYTVKPCAHCTNWTWVKHDRTERVFCSRRECEHKEGVTRAAENPRPTYKVMGRMGVDLGTFAIDEFDATYADKLELIRALGWLEVARFDNHITVMRVS